MMMLC